ncbi:thioester domain-containing protein [Nocardiopsis sp. EMB25]|uniref:thioester domain-containing protein n=1 Tax=Nocardiopsis sp. EMB25 TaxID=2835867 RepID=UPI002284BA91|nr:thioester domain-containing protein [Nocardiopsis sp. EMB25]MCY9787759.1 thioester domain-containing protein [Nocardiopsis sp. EMB25]
MTDLTFPRSVARAGFSATVAGLLAFGLAAPAAAEPEPYEGSVRGQYVGNAESGETIWMNDDRTRVSLFNLKLENGNTLTTYCIDLETGIRGDAWYREDAWANYPGKGDFAEPAKVHWVLQNGYPAVSTDELAEAAGAPGRVSDKQALSATQAAIWHFSNGADLTRAEPATTAIYEYLIGNAVDLNQGEEPDATLSITPGEASGQAGETVGEFLVETSFEGEIPVELGSDVPEGVDLVDLESGEEVNAVENGDTVGFSVPEDAEDGSASFSLSASATVQTGRLFKGEEVETQTLITAEEGEVEVSASASVDWTAAPEPSPEPSPSPSESPEPSPEPTPAPTPTPEPTPEPTPTPTPDDNNTPSLPVTGGALAGLVAAGVAALGAGAGAIYLSRKRKANSTDSLEG